jgi:hypothetical protein
MFDDGRLTGPRANIVIFMFTKPRSNFMTEVGFISTYRRLNVVLTRAKKHLIMVVNLRIWNTEFVRAAKKVSLSGGLPERCC